MDELVFLGPSSDFTKGRIVVARSKENNRGNFQWELGAAETTDELYLVSSFELGSVLFFGGFGEQYLGHLEVGDVNGDGRDDLVALGAHFPSSEEETEEPIRTELVVFLNDGSGSLNVDKRLKFVIGENLPIQTFTLTQLDTDPEVEVAFATDRGSLVAEFQLDKQELQVVQQLPVRSVLSAQSGDFDGDGLLDLALAGAEGVSVLFAEPTLP